MIWSRRLKRVKVQALARKNKLVYQSMSYLKGQSHVQRALAFLYGEFFVAKALW